MSVRKVGILQVVGRGGSTFLRVRMHRFHRLTQSTGIIENRLTSQSSSVRLDMAYIVDLQGFKRPINEFVLKEFAVIEVGNDDRTHPINLLFEPIYEWNALPAKYKRVNSWLKRNYHGLL